jgi:hypothetical protein
VVLPIVVLTLFYLKAALGYTLLNQIRYVTALALPLLSFVWLSVRHLEPRRRKAVVSAAFVLMAVVQIVPIDAAWHDRGVVSRQLATYALVRPEQHNTRAALQWIDRNAKPGDKVVFTPHAGSAWLTLASFDTPLHVRRLNIYRTTNLVYDSVGMAAAMRDSLRSAQWVVTSARNNTEGLQDALVTELVLPAPATDSTPMAWHGVPLKLMTSVGGLRVYAVQAAEDSSSTRLQR